MLSALHEDYVVKYQIDTASSRRRRQGFEAALFAIPALFKGKGAKKDKTEEGIDKAVEQIVKNETAESSDAELVAVIAAAVAAYEGTTDTSGFVVRSIRKIKRQ